MGQGRYLKRRMMQLLFSISLVSFLISISSWLCYGFQTVRFCVTTLPLQLITHSINRNCIFLICNGLLVSIARTSSGLITCACSSEDQTVKNMDEEEEEEEEEEELIEKNMGGPVVDKKVVMVHSEGSSLKRWMFDKATMEKSGESEDEDIKELSMDEVNRRFDEFIWKMKEEIRLEASYQKLATYTQV